MFGPDLLVCSYDFPRCHTATDDRRRLELLLVISDVTHFRNWNGRRKVLQHSKGTHSHFFGHTHKICVSWVQKEKRGKVNLNRRGVSGAAGGLGYCYRYCVAHHSQLELWAVLETRPEGPLPSATFAKERYCSFTLSALSEVFTTYLL
jgi:hypothetical protein